MDDSGNAPECVGEVALNQVTDDDDIDLVAVPGVGLPQRISLPGPHDSDDKLGAAINWNTMDFLTPERDNPLPRDGPRCVNRRSRIRQLTVYRG